MARFIKSHKKSHGALPGSLTLIGNRKMEKPEIHYMLFNRENFEENRIDTMDQIPQNIPEGTLLWVNIYGPQDHELVMLLCFKRKKWL